MSSIQFPGRNDPCWCGSGAKYKKCHMDFDRRLHEFELAGAEVPPHSLLKTSEQLKGIRESAKINIAVLDYVAEHIRAGITTEDIDKWVYEQTVLRGGIPAPLNYEGYPKSVCTSIDEVVCHGIPSPDRVLKEGDIIVPVYTFYYGTDENEDDLEEGEFDGDEIIWHSGLSVTYEDVSDASDPTDMLFCFVLNDVFGGYDMTEAIAFEM